MKTNIMISIEMVCAVIVTDRGGRIETDAIYTVYVELDALADLLVGGNNRPTYDWTVSGAGYHLYTVGSTLVLARALDSEIAVDEFGCLNFDHRAIKEQGRVVREIEEYTPRDVVMLASEAGLPRLNTGDLDRAYLTGEQIETMHREISCPDTTDERLERICSDFELDSESMEREIIDVIDRDITHYRRRRTISLVSAQQ